MSIEVLGPALFAKNGQGQLVSRVGTFFPRHRLVVTRPGIHASQRLALIDHLNQQRQAQSQPPLTPEQEAKEMACSVDLFFEPGVILIRPDPDDMELAFTADELLQELVSKRNVKFLCVFNPKVRQPIKERGEYWRISVLPQSVQEMRRLIADSKVAIQERPIYYYSRISGVRFVTFHEFARLEDWPAEELKSQLQEIAAHARRRNRLGFPEVDFFGADPLRFGARDFAGANFLALPESELRQTFAQLKEHFCEAVEARFRRDEPLDEVWRTQLFTRLVCLQDDLCAAEVLQGLSPEFFLQIEWLPGGRFEEGEFILDSVYAEADEGRSEGAVPAPCEPKARRFIFNFIREHGDLEYVNVGRLVHSLSVRRPVADGRREVYLAEMKPRGQATPEVRLLRILKWGVRERLDEGKSLLQALLESEEYADYVLDRRLGCRQLGMNLPGHISIRRVAEVYDGPREEFRGLTIYASYSERQYIGGIASDKLPAFKCAQDEYALRLARLLGKAAASNLIAGRTYDYGRRVVFDDGDEIILEDSNGLPRDLIVGDHSGAFGEYERPLGEFVRDYAKPVNRRLADVPRPRAFAEAYLSAFSTQFEHVQSDYRKRRRAFDAMFKHLPRNTQGSFAYRWECVLKRLDQTDAATLGQAIRKEITVLGLGSPPGE